MDEVTMRERVRAARVGRLATVTPDGGPHVVPCCFALDGGVVVTPIDHKPKATPALQRLANVRANPRAALLVDAYDDDWSQLWWVRADGDADVLTDGSQHAEGVELLAAKYDQYRQTPITGAVIAITVDRWLAWP
jgi:PPOX class probable F420-dependent enzyme